MSRALDVMAQEARFSAYNYHPMDVVLERGLGVWVWDTDGRKYLDGLSAYSAVNQGHCHPRILGAMIEQAQRLTLTSRAFHNDQLGPYCAEMCALLGANKVLPMNSGAEAVESALKVARKWAYKVKGIPSNQAEILVCSNNFHGRTLAVVSFSTDPTAREGFGPYIPGFRVVPYGDAQALEAAITPNTAAFLVEPIQGEAGVIIPPDGYLQQVRALCSQHNVLLILDEVQTGLGRTGRLLAAEHAAITPDLTLIGKALSGGFYPVSAVLAHAAVLDVLRPGEHGSTFGGNPLACAVGRMAMRVLVEEDMIGNADRMGQRMLAGLSNATQGKVRQVRGRGLMLAVELDPDQGGAYSYCKRLRDLGILCKDTHTHTIRFSPPLVIDADTVDWAVEQFATVLA